jgi:hypothetical protein
MLPPHSPAIDPKPASTSHASGIGGPGDLSLVDHARQYLVARGMRRAILPIQVSDKAARGMGFSRSNGVRGTLSWKDWLSRRAAEERAAA